MLTAVYYIVRDRVPYKDLGAEHFNRRDKVHVAKRLVRRLEDLGFAVEARPTTVEVSI
jgi:transposase